jgi:hypothetical protein
MGEVEEYCGPEGCQGEVMLHEPNVKLIARQFQECLSGEKMQRAS